MANNISRLISSDTYKNIRGYKQFLQNLFAKTSSRQKYFSYISVSSCIYRVQRTIRPSGSSWPTRTDTIDIRYERDGVHSPGVPHVPQLFPNVIRGVVHQDLFWLYAILVKSTWKCSISTFSKRNSQRFYDGIKGKFPNVENQQDIPHGGISFSFKCFLTEDKDLIVDCNTLVIVHGCWEPCYHRAPHTIIKHLGGVQICSYIIPASTDN